jgi:NAD(P)-dependent dehydrogenase (short-subunit alcohol dehydrogenase family)
MNMLNDVKGYSMATTVVIGANKGIGLGLVSNLKLKGHDVYATCRHSSPELDSLNVNVIEGIDISNDAVVQTLEQKLSHVEHIDWLIHVSGIWRSESLDDLNFVTMTEQWEVNALGPLRSVSALLSKLKTGSKIAVLTSRMGSIEDNGSGGRYGYRMSKAALNAGAKSLAVDLEPKGIAVAILHPGFVATHMTDHKGIPVEESVNGLVARIDALTTNKTGTFWHMNGEVLPW